VVLDEAHHCFSDKRMAALEEVKDNLYPNAHIYLLSATLSSGKQDMIEGIFGKFKTSTVTLKDAIEGDILPDPKIYVVAMELDNSKRHQEIQIGNDPKAPVVKWEDRAKYIYKNIPCIIQCTEFQKNIYLSQSVDYWNERYQRSHSEFMRVKAANYGSQRKRFLGELKTGVIRQLIERLPRNNRFVCFCASVAQANALDYVNTISSKRPAKSNQLIIDRFNSREIDHIYAVGMITEGMNLTDIQTGIIVQLDGKERLFIQKFGRSLRAEDPVTFIFYYKNTQDENYLKGALENIDSKFVQHITVDQLNTIKL
jgi:superfamily II DNA or RNA helicase